MAVPGKSIFDHPSYIYIYIYDFLCLHYGRSLQGFKVFILGRPTNLLSSTCQRRSLSSESSISKWNRPSRPGADHTGPQQRVWRQQVEQTVETWTRSYRDFSSESSISKWNRPCRSGSDQKGASAASLASASGTDRVDLDHHPCCVVRPRLQISTRFSWTLLWLNPGCCSLKVFLLA